MIFEGNYDLPTLISAVLTFVVIVLAIRFGLFYANRKGPQIRKPDWIDDEKFNLKKKK